MNVIIYCEPHSGDDVESFGAQWVKCLSQGLLGGGDGTGVEGGSACSV